MTLLSNVLAALAVGLVLSAIFLVAAGKLLPAGVMMLAVSLTIYYRERQL